MTLIAVRLAAGRRYQALKVLKMIVRGHYIVEPGHLVGQGVVANVDEEVEVVAADGLLENALRLARAEARGVAGDEEGVACVAVLARHRAGLDPVLPPLDEILVDAVSDFGRAGRGNDPEAAARSGVEHGFSLRVLCILPVHW